MTEPLTEDLFQEFESAAVAHEKSEAVLRSALVAARERLQLTLTKRPGFVFSGEDFQLDAPPDGGPGVCRGLQTVATQVGTLRTHHSDAHGQPPTKPPLTSYHARLAVDAAGVLSTFLM